MGSLIRENRMPTPKNLSFAFDETDDSYRKLAEDQNSRHRNGTYSFDLAPVKVDIPAIPGQAVLPNVLALSSIFVPLGYSKGRRYLEDYELVHRWKTFRITFTGVQLDESDRDVLMALILLSRDYPMGEAFFFTRLQLLKMVRPKASKFGSSDYEWLRRSIMRLSSATFLVYRQLEHTDKWESATGSCRPIRLVDRWEFFEKGRAVAKFDPLMAAFFRRQQFSLIDLQRRAEIDILLAKSLQALLATAKEPVQRFEFEWLCRKHDYHLPAHKLRKKFTNACEDLIRVGILAGYSWYKNSSGEVILQVVKALHTEDYPALIPLAT